VSENRALRRTFGPKREEVAGEWRRLHNEGLHNLYASLNIIRVIKSMRMRLAGYIAHMVETRNAYKILVEKPEGNRPLRRHVHRLEGNIKMDLRERVWEGVDWIYLVQDTNQWRAFLKTVVNLRVP
jgi:hypothetical protein